MEYFCTEKDLALQRKRTRRLAFLFYGLCLFTLILFIVLCLMTNTASAARMLRLALVCLLSCWICLFPFMVIVPFLCRFTLPALGGLSASSSVLRINPGELCA